MRRDGGRTPSYPHSPLGEKNKLPLVSAHHTHVLGNFFFYSNHRDKSLSQIPSNSEGFTVRHW